MKALVVYDSFFGHTEQIARAIGRGLGAPEGVEVLRAGDVQPGQLAGLDLLIVGSPTRGGQPSQATVTFLDSIPAGALQGVRVAAFDTRTPLDDPKMSRVLRALSRVFGWAAPRIVQRLEKQGGVPAVPPEGFVLGTHGPLREGEIERAAAWARRIAASS